MNAKTTGILSVIGLIGTVMLVVTSLNNMNTKNELLDEKLVSATKEYDTAAIKLVDSCYNDWVLLQRGEPAYDSRASCVVELTKMRDETCKDPFQTEHKVIQYMTVCDYPRLHEYLKLMPQTLEQKYTPQTASEEHIPETPSENPSVNTEPKQEPKITTESPEVQNKEFIDRYIAASGKLISLNNSQTSAIDDFNAGIIKYEDFLAKQNKARQTASDIRTEIESLHTPTEWQESVDYQIKSIDAYIGYLQMTTTYAQAKSTNSSMDVISDIETMMSDRLHESLNFTKLSLASMPKTKSESEKEKTNTEAKAETKTNSVSKTELRNVTAHPLIPVINAESAYTITFAISTELVDVKSEEITFPDGFNVSNAKMVKIEAVQTGFPNGKLTASGQTLIWNHDIAYRPACCLLVKMTIADIVNGHTLDNQISIVTKDPNGVIIDGPSVAEFQLAKG